LIKIGIISSIFHHKDIFLNLLNLFSRTSVSKQQATKNEAPAHWIKCQSCQSLMYYKEVENQNYVCPKCGFHLRIGVKERLALLADKDTFVEHDANLKPIDPLKFVDKVSYVKRIEDGTKKTGRSSSVVSSTCKIGGEEVELVIFDFAFMGGSLGSVEGEKIVRAVNRAIENKHGLIIISASGGARMQESTFSLMQMSKTSAALSMLAKHKLPYISVLTDPTMGGVSASFATLGDIIIAEPGALVGFAGQRVIKQTIGSDLPDGFQRAEFLLEKGSIDMVVNRNELKATLSDLLRLLKV
jgi:acetyl-CoA carboxylase carboxyl transferase subunit beta